MESRAGPELWLASPWLNATGTLGFTPANHWTWREPQGAFVTNPISLRARSAAEEPQIRCYPGGLLMHTGWPNPGFRRALKNSARRWADAGLPVWPHLLASDPYDLNEMVRGLEGLEGVAAVEVGLPPDGEPQQCLALVEAALGELPVVAAVPLHRAREAWVQQLAGLGASALALTAPRGCLPVEEDGLVSGRLYGPALFPLVLEAARRLKSLNLPVIAGCGVFNMESGKALQQAGAAAVQLDLVLWQPPEQG